MGQELVPFANGEITVFFAGPLGPPAGDERPVVGDHVFGVDRYWRTQVLELSEYPARAWESSRRNPFPSSMRLKRTGQSPRPSGGRIQHQKGSLQRHAWSDGRYPKVWNAIPTPP